jgi:hypothetical protein
MKLLTLSDGYGDSIAVPRWYPKYWKWPEIIKLMTKGLELENLSRYGAGNEFIVNQLKQNINAVDVIMIQWAQPNRLDLVLDHDNINFWQNVIASDPIYKNNTVDCASDKFWLSSGSTKTEVVNYHQQYISVRQHQLRTQIYIEYAKLLLQQQKINYRFMLVENSEYVDVDANWIWHEPLKGMNDFRYKSRYCDLELGLTQPTPLVSFDFIKQHVMPSIDLPWRSDRDITGVENMLFRHYKEAVKYRYD